MMKQLTVTYLLLLLFFNSSAQIGLRADYFNGTDLKNKIFSRIDAKIDFTWGAEESPARGIEPTNFSVRWVGILQAPESGTYTFSAKVDDGLRVWVGGKRIIDQWGMNDSQKFNGRIVMKAGEQYDIKVEYFNGMLEGEITLLWILPSEVAAKKMTPHAIPADRYTQTIIDKPTPKPPVPVANTPKPKPAKKPKPPVVMVKNPPKDTIARYTPSNIQFEKSTAKILTQSYTALNDLAAMLLRYPQLTLTVNGHTDNIGDATLNQQLSEERAKVVVVYLQQKGIVPNRLKSNGFGSSKPLVKDSKPNPANRRVEFIIEGY